MGAKPRCNFEMPPSNSVAVLILDENKLSRRRLSDPLSRVGWQVSEAETAEAGLALAKQGPQVIIVGLHLADMSGSEVCKRLKREPATRTIPVLRTSSRGAEGEGVAPDFIFEADAYLLEPVDPTELVATVRVLSRLRAAEAKAEINRARLEGVINSLVEGVITVDRTGCFLTMNPAALRIHGFESAEMMLMTPDEQESLIECSSLDGSLLPRERWPSMRAAGGEVVSNFEMRVRRRDTGKTWIGSYNASLVRAADGTADTVLVTFFDVTDRKEAEKALNEAQSRLSQMEEFSYTVSHDLRAPLRSIKGYAEILVEDQGSRMKGDGKLFLERIVENGNRMERLVNDVLKISRISSAKVKLDRVATHSILASIVREYVGPEPASARFVIDPLPPVVGHESLCIQVFSNLLSNAAKFVKPGVTPQIRVWADQIGDIVRINISDNGIGISPEYHQKIFGMFERLDVDNRYGGTGIGLAIVRRAVEKMNGRVGVESDGQSGSRFWVELPAWTGEK